MPHTLVLFDIDGTILLSGPVVHEVFLGTVADVCGKAPSAMEFSFSGMTDRAIFDQLLEIVEMPDPEGRLFADFRAEYPRRLEEIYADAPTPHLLPGVADLIAEMHAEPEFALGLATGNLRAAAVIKLARFGLAEFFPAGGFGDHHHERAFVVRDGMAAARTHHGWTEDPQVWVIGDTPNDITAARSAGARVLAVATGFSGPEELAGADVVLPDLEDARAVLRSIRTPGSARTG